MKQSFSLGSPKYKAALGPLTVTAIRMVPERTRVFKPHTLVTHKPLAGFCSHDRDPRAQNSLWSTIFLQVATRSSRLKKNMFLGPLGARENVVGSLWWLQYPASAYHRHRSFGRLMGATVSVSWAALCLGLAWVCCLFLRGRWPCRGSFLHPIIIYGPAADLTKSLASISLSL